MGTGSIDKAVICDKDGQGIWAQTKGFNVVPAEMKGLCAGFGDTEGVNASGLHIAGVKYFTIRADERSIYGKKEQEGIVAVKTKQAVLIAHYAPGTQPGAAVTVVEALADYLISLGY